MKQILISIVLALTLLLSSCTNGLTSCTGGGAHTDTHLYRYTYTHTDMCTH